MIYLRFPFELRIISSFAPSRPFCESHSQLSKGKETTFSIHPFIILLPLLGKTSSTHPPNPQTSPKYHPWCSSYKPIVPLKVPQALYFVPPILKLNFNQLLQPLHPQHPIPTWDSHRLPHNTPSLLPISLKFLNGNSLIFRVSAASGGHHASFAVENMRLVPTSSLFDGGA